MKKFKRGVSIAEVVVSMAMILIISLSAVTACIACSSVISSAKNSAKIISYSQTSVQCFNASLSKNDVLLTFQNQINFCFGEKVLTTKTENNLKDNGVTFIFSFDCGVINFNIIELDFEYEVLVISYAKNSQDAVYEYQRSYSVE